MTQEIRHKAYIDCLSDIKNYRRSNCCASFYFRDYLEDLTEAKIIFCELYSFRTTPPDLAIWFYSRQERIEALEKCIELTK